ncbi:universal stress protein [Microbacterium sp.]|uniref:universal stress protein n=1 Tax=Microbacterium sp. TaxID=51671 RepID=UPI0028126C1F|nr:universal stress protein [Microbacterium sp.]
MNNHALPPRRIVGVDGSAQSRAALLWAATRSAADGVVLVLAHVAEPQDESGGGETLLAAAAHSLLSRHPQLGIERLLLDGPVWRGLAESARPDDLLVIGTGSSGYAPRRVIGSLGVQLAIAASCAVALIPDVDLRFRRGVVAGIGRAESAETIAAAIAAHAPGRPITLVHADPSGRCEEALAAAERALGPEAPVRRRLLSGPAADALLDAALDKELLVLGPGADGADRPPIGAVTHAVLMNATAPILLTRSSVG